MVSKRMAPYPSFCVSGRERLCCFTSLIEIDDKEDDAAISSFSSLGLFVFLLDYFIYKPPPKTCARGMPLLAHLLLTRGALCSLSYKL